MTPDQRTTAEGVLYTDMYQLTMAQLYYRTGLHERTAQFDHFFRSYPDYGAHQAGYCITAGLEWLLDWMRQVRFGDDELDFLRAQVGETGTRLFDDDFLSWLRQNASFDALHVRAVPEGRVVHPNTPLTVVRGPLAVAQILETPLLNQLNYPTLVATKAARIDAAGRGRPLLEFGLRRAQDRAATAGGRATLIGGADYTSNVGLSAVVGLEPKGTHAHSMVQAFMALGEGELGAFRAYADVYPDDCLLLVDTIDTLESGVPNAIRVFEELRRKGHDPVGVRLDSGDLAYLSIQTARMLDDAGFPEASIVLSNQLDELTLLQILRQIDEEAARYGVEPDAVIGRLVYGVGTRMITSRGDAALDGVYKLVAITEDSGGWRPAIKVSETPAKTPNPGDKRLNRLYDRRDKAVADVLSLPDEDLRAGDALSLRHPLEPSKRRTLAQSEITAVEPLLETVWQDGRSHTGVPDLETLRQRRADDLARLDPGVRRLLNPHRYHVSLTEPLLDLKQALVQQALGEDGG